MKTNVFFLVVVMIVTSSNIFAQSVCSNEPYKNFGVEMNAGVSFPTSKMAYAKLNTGLGGEILLHYNFMPHLGLYGGWGWNQLSADESFAGKEIDFEETGYIMGLEWKHPLGCTPLSYYVRGAALYNHLEVENNPQGDIIGDTGHGWGYQLAAGLNIPLGKNFHLTPGVKFNSLKRDLNFDSNVRALRQNYISLRVGILYEF